MFELEVEIASAPSLAPRTPVIICNQHQQPIYRPITCQTYEAAPYPRRVKPRSEASAESSGGVRSSATRMPFTIVAQTPSVALTTPTIRVPQVSPLRPGALKFGPKSHVKPQNLTLTQHPQSFLQLSLATKLAYFPHFTVYHGNRAKQPEL